MTSPAPVPVPRRVVLGEVAAADPDQRDEIHDFVVVEVVDQFAQRRLGRVVALVKTLLAVLARVDFRSGIGFVRKVLEVERAGFENDVLDLVEADFSSAGSSPSLIAERFAMGFIPPSRNHIR